MPYRQAQVQTMPNGRPGTPRPLFKKLDPGLGLPNVFAAFLDMPYPAFLDSALRDPKLGRYSYITADPFLVLRSKGHQIEIESKGIVEHKRGNPFVVLQGILKQLRIDPAPGLPPFQGGAVGYMAYELGRHLEDLPGRAVDDLGLSEMCIGLYAWAIAHDSATDEMWAIATGLPEGSPTRARERLDWIEERLGQARPCPQSRALPAGGLTSNFSREAYIQAVNAVKRYVVQGDVYQVNLSQRFQASIDCTPWDLYLRLRQVNPAPFAAYLQYPELAVLSASPEEFLRVDNGVAQSRPMKGTRPRGKTPDGDHELAAELAASVKDRAENVMIVDLVRNDLGKVCVPGSVEAPELFAIEKYPTVFQMVSTVRGRLAPHADAVDLLRACFPGGSVTGAPKIRAMQIIDELEPTQRSVYCGAIGYVGFDGAMLASIPIRTLLMKGQRVYFQVGGGIVADSDPQAEYEETLHKARGSLLALGLDRPT